MGAYGAVNAALENPDQYAAVFSYSGLMDMIERFDNPRGIDFEPVFGDREKLLTGNYDLMEKVHNYKEQFSVNVDNATRFYLYCGLSDRILHMSDQMYMNMRDQGYYVKYQTAEGNHDWKYWDSCVEETIKIILNQKSENQSIVNQKDKMKVSI